MSTQGFVGFYTETPDYAAASAFWRALGFEPAFETDHGSGQWQHPSGGPYVFIAEQKDPQLDVVPMLGVADAATFVAPAGATWSSPFTPEHWGVLDGAVVDPDGRTVRFQAPLPPGVVAPDADEHHAEKYG